MIVLGIIFVVLLLPCGANRIYSRNFRGFFLYDKWNPDGNRRSENGIQYAVFLFVSSSFFRTGWKFDERDRNYIQTD